MMYLQICIVLLSVTNLLTCISAKPLPNPTFTEDYPTNCQPICPAISAPTVTTYITYIQTTTIMACPASHFTSFAIPSASLDCQPDNCLRQLEKASATIAQFCATYTTSLNTAFTNLPDDVSNCANTNEISSACSCIMTEPPLSPVATSSTIPMVTEFPHPTSLNCQTDNCLRQLASVSSVIAPFCMTYTTTTAPNIHIEGLPGSFAICAGDTYVISSACSCIMTAFLPTYRSEYSVPVAITQTTIQTTTVLFTSTVTPPPISPIATAVSFVTSLDCQADNCLRALERGFPAIAPFCATYTKLAHNVSKLPSDIVNCEGNANAISSACSCVMQPSTGATLTAAAIPAETGWAENANEEVSNGIGQGNGETIDDWDRNDDGVRGKHYKGHGSWSWWMKAASEKQGKKPEGDKLSDDVERTIGNLFG